MFRNETEFVRWLRELLPKPGGRLRLGVGDDAALIEVSPAHELILTTDLSIERVHFFQNLHPPRSVGHRALARSLSDIAAMGGIPRFALVSLGISHQATRPWLREFYAGLLALAKQFGVKVVGGDTALLSENAFVDVLVAGEVPRGRALRRSGARPGDLLFVSGTLGLSALGLELLKSGRARSPAYSSPAVRAHLFPEPRCRLGRFLSAKRLASATIDVSDGLSTDLRHLCGASGVGAYVWADRIPVPDVSRVRVSGGPGPLALALHGGEDYELLFTVPRRKASQLPRRFQGVALHQIGEIRRPKEVDLIELGGKTRPLRPRGYDHFRKR